MYLEIMFVNINYLAIELMIDVVNIVVNISYLATELINVVNIVFNSSDVFVNVVKWMCFEFENCTGSVANLNIFFWFCTGLICVKWPNTAEVN
jgi:hypothetical protein